MRKKPNYIMIHHSAVSHNANADQFAATNNYHKSLWNFKSSLGYYVGYNYEIAKNGRVRQARANGEKTAACYQQGMNDGRCIHIALDGHFDNEKPAPSQIFALRDLMKKLVKEFNVTKDNIVFHSEYANKTCPGKNMDINFVKSFGRQSLDKETDTKEEVIKILKQALELIQKI